MITLPPPPAASTDAELLAILCLLRKLLLMLLPCVPRLAPLLRLLSSGTGDCCWKRPARLWLNDPGGQQQCTESALQRSYSQLGDSHVGDHQLKFLMLCCVLACISVWRARGAAANSIGFTAATTSGDQRKSSATGGGDGGLVPSPVLLMLSIPPIPPSLILPFFIRKSPHFVL